MCSKRFDDNEKKVNKEVVHEPLAAIGKLKEMTPAKYDESFEFSLKLGVDPKNPDHNVRGTVALPHGTGKKEKICVIARGDAIQAALDAGAEYAGEKEIIDKIFGGWTDFTLLITSPDMMREVGKLGKVLGPRGLMPTPKAGTVAKDIVKAVEEALKGRVEFKTDKRGVVNLAFGKVSFTSDQIYENFTTIMNAVQNKKPATAKGTYMLSLSLSTTLGPGLKCQVTA